MERNPFRSCFVYFLEELKARKIVFENFRPLQSITSDIDTVQKNVSKIETLQTRILHAVSQKDVEKEKQELNDLNGKANSV